MQSEWFEQQLARSTCTRKKININSNTPVFGPCTYQIRDCDLLVSNLDDILLQSLAWARKNSPLEGDIVKNAIGRSMEFFTQHDLFYDTWCSKNCIEDAIVFANYLKQTIS